MHPMKSHIDNDTILIASVIVIVVVLYFVPSAVAICRHKRNTTAIFVLNLFAGWTFIAWIGALVWAVTKDEDSD